MKGYTTDGAQFYTNNGTGHFTRVTPGFRLGSGLQFTLLYFDADKFLDLVWVPFPACNEVSCLETHYLVRALGCPTYLPLVGAGCPQPARCPQPDLGVRYVAPCGLCAEVCPCYSNIQDALDAAGPHDGIKVAAGTYASIHHRDGITQTVYISKTVSIRGGYSTADWDASDPETNPTTLDAQGRGRVLYIIGDIGPTIEGLRITGGDATGLGGHSWGFDVGGGINISGGSAIITGNQIIGNHAEFGGGVHVTEGSTATIANNRIVSNTTEGSAGLHLGGSNPTIEGNTISNNIADYGGGGVDMGGASATLEGNLVTANWAGFTGGGLSISWNSSGLLTNNVIAGNHAGDAGSGIHIQGSSPRLLHNAISSNAGGDGSAIHITDQPEYTSTVTMINTMLVSHTIGISITGGNRVSVDGVLWFNTPITMSLSPTATVAVEHQYEGDPAFLADGYHLTPTSAAVNRGVHAGVSTDIDGELRPAPLRAAPDLGADEVSAQLYLPLVSVPISIVPPVGVVQVPAEAYVGDEIILDASASLDPAGGPLYFVWRQAHNPDRYSGLEYVTGNNVRLESLDGSVDATFPDSVFGFSQVRFTPQYPGNYRFTVMAVGSRGRSIETVDVLVRLSESAFVVRGFNDGQFVPWSRTDVETAIDRMVDNGATHVRLHGLTLYMPEAESTEIEPCPIEPCPNDPSVQSPCNSWPAQVLIETIHTAHQQGLEVMLSAAMCVGPEHRAAHEIQPPDWGTWFRNYSCLMVDYATLAQETGADMFIVGGEIVRSHQQEQHWRDLVREVRRVYSGSLTYSDIPSYGGDWPEFPFPAWDTLDIIGFSLCPHASGEGHPPVDIDTDPSVEEMRQSIAKLVEGVLPTVQRYSLPVIAVEMGINNWDGANSDSPTFWPADRAVDNQEQVDWYEAVLGLMAGYEWFKGLNVHMLQLRDPPWRPEGSHHAADIRGQPAEQAIRLWYGR